MQDLNEGIVPINFSWRANNQVQQTVNNQTQLNKGELYASLAGAIYLIFENFGNRSFNNETDILILRNSILNKINERVNPYKVNIGIDFINYFISYNSFYNDIVTKEFVNEMLNNIVNNIAVNDVIINEGTI